MTAQPKQEELVRMGDEAEVLIQNSAFNSTVNQLVELSFQTFVNSKAEDKEARERSYSHYRALVDIVATLQQRVAVRDEINAANAGDNNQEDGTDHE
jgi:hypothetical protein